MTQEEMPVIFAAHGAPILLDDRRWMGELASWSQAMHKPSGVLMISAHWEQRPLTIGATTTVPLVYDFSGFPEKYYQTKYPSPGAPALAGRVRDLLTASDIAWTDEPLRGLDHGAYVPLVPMYPAADVPILQVSLPGLNPRELFTVGQAMAPLRQEGVLVFGSGSLIHNLRFAFTPGTPKWAQEFDLWTEETISRFDVDALLDFKEKAPGVSMALPTWEHYAPLLVAAGAASSGVHSPSFPINGFWRDRAYTKRSVQFG